jgi:hypothetical protein
LKLKKWLENRTNYENVKELTFHNVWNFIVAIFRKDITKQKWAKEQAEWRRNRVKDKSLTCFEKGECFCGCDLEGMLYQNDSCEKECFPKWMNKNQWYDNSIKQ